MPEFTLWNEHFTFSDGQIHMEILTFAFSDGQIHMVIWTFAFCDGPLHYVKWTFSFCDARVHTIKRRLAFEKCKHSHVSEHRCSRNAELSHKISAMFSHHGIQISQNAIRADGSALAKTSRSHRSLPGTTTSRPPRSSTSDRFAWPPAGVGLLKSMLTMIH